MDEKILSLEENKKIGEYTSRLQDLRKDGTTKLVDSKILLTATKRNKLISEEERKTRIDALEKEIADAKVIASKNKEEDKKISKEAVKYVNEEAKKIQNDVREKQNGRMKKAKEFYTKEVADLKSEFDNREKEIESKYANDPKMHKSEKEICSYERKSALFDAKTRYKEQLNKARSIKNQAYIDHVQKNRELRNGKDNFIENLRLKWLNFIYNFEPKRFFLSNGLYIAIIIFFIVCIILAPVIVGSNLFSLPNLLTILEQCSTRMFYALGVAGLILLAGTDLSIGRMVALGSIITGMILHPGKNIAQLFNLGPWDFTAMPMLMRLLMALVLSVALCTLFSAFSGFFAAKLKMHPFVSTMATQLIIYGTLMFGTKGTPFGSIDSSIKDAIGGRWVIGYLSSGQAITFPKLIIPAIIAIIIAWFIWNKTTFGKNMYAVGGNAEAASVSGISVFKVTMMVFVMAGIFYGCGSFLETFRTNPSAGTGQGFEMDAIAACVVGGISFNGGIGKISGAVIGVIIFTGLTYCLTFLGIDTNLQFVFKGFIIVAAVALDSIKYLKRK